MGNTKNEYKLLHRISSKQIYLDTHIHMKKIGCGEKIVLKHTTKIV